MGNSEVIARGRGHKGTKLQWKNTINIKFFKKETYMMLLSCIRYSLDFWIQKKANHTKYFALEGGGKG